MAISLLDFANGDLDYVAKLNNNFDSIEAALAGVESMISGTVQAQLTAPNAFEAIFGTANSAIIGASSYVAAISSTNITVTAGYAWRVETKAVVKNASSQTVAFSGATAGTYYIYVGDDGVCSRGTSSGYAFYSVYWSGSALSDLTRIVKIAWADYDWQLGQVSTALAATYTKLDDRLEAGEAKAVKGEKAHNLVTRKLVKSVAGGVGVTLTPEESAYAYFEFTGALTADITVGIDELYAPILVNVKNSTTGEFTLTVIGVGGTGVEVAQGYSTLLHFDAGDDLRYAYDDPSTISKVVPYAATITLDWSKYDVAYIVLAGNATINHTNGRPGQKCLLYLEQDSTGGRTVTWGANLRFGTDVGGISLSSSANKVDEIAFSYNWVHGLFNAVSVSRGYDIV